MEVVGWVGGLGLFGGLVGLAGWVRLVGLVVLSRGLLGE